MPTTATVEERKRGRRFSTSSARREYVVRVDPTGPDPETAAMAAMVSSSNVPDLVAGYPRRLQDWSVDELSDGIYLGSALWQSLDANGEQSRNQQPNTFRISFDISGQTQRVYVSRETTGSYMIGAEDATPDYKQAIGVQQDGTVEGCDQLIPYMTWEATYTMLAQDLTTAYTATLYATVGTINDSEWQGFAPGVLLLIGVSGQKRFVPDADDPQTGHYVYDLQFKFAVSVDDEIKIGTKVIPKKGWDYLWVQFGEYPENTTAGTLFIVKRPRFAFTERIYRKKSFLALGINNNGSATPADEDGEVSP